MKLTKFGQSCVLIENNGKKILVDPGAYKLEESYIKDYWMGADVLLVTHKHGDHIHEKSVKKILANPKTKFYTTQEVADAYPSLKPNIVKQGRVLEFEGFKVEVVKAIHGYVSLLKGGNEIDENVGYIIDDGRKRVYFTSDTISFKNDYKCDVLFLPCCNHGLVMGPWDAAFFAKETGAELVLPCHDDNPKHPTNWNEVKEEFGKQGLKYKILKVLDSLEV